jgi:hypothetical protein
VLVCSDISFIPLDSETKMSTIYRDDRIDVLEEEVDYLNTALGQDIIQI